MPAPTGTVFDGITPVAMFTINPAGAVVLAPLSTPVRVTAATFTPDTGELVLTWDVRPAVSSVRVSYQYDAFRPGYRGPDDAVETPRHVMASPASVGSSIPDALLAPYWGERELIKLAYADASSTRAEGVLPPTTTFLYRPKSPPSGWQQPRRLGTLAGLAPLAVPNLPRPGP